jgi:penicillin-binding protein 2
MVDIQTGEVTTPEIEPARRVALNKTYLDIVKKGMRRVITHESPWLEIPGVTSIGKTGSAQNPRNGKSDALFIMAAPAENPQIAIAVIVENAGFGSGSAGPIGSFMAERYLTGRIDPKRDIYMKSMMSKNSVDLGKN